MRYLFYFLLLAGCKESAHPVKTGYFDIADYFRKEAHKLEEEHTGMLKSVSSNDLKESKISDSVSWMDELRPFIECDINKPAWSNSYKTDSVRDNGTVTVIYTATEDIPVKKVKLVVKSDRVQSMEIWKHRKNIYYDISEHYQYTKEGYIINGKQKIRFLDQTEFTITAEFKS